MASFIVRLLINAAIGAVVGLIVGIALEVTGVISNPFWLMSAGIFLGAIVTGGLRARSGTTTKE